MKLLRLLPLALGACALLAGIARGQSPEIPFRAQRPGDAAPDFTLQATDGKTYSLSKDLRGRWLVLAWFPQGLHRWLKRPSCNSLRESGGLIRKYDTALLHDQCRHHLDENIAFAKKEQADFPMLANPDKKVAFAYGVIAPDAPPERQFARRWTFYIDLPRARLR